jgi:hypothetical protein
MKAKRENQEGIVSLRSEGDFGHFELSTLVDTMTKYDLRNYSEKDSLALRIAYLADKTWIRDPMPKWSSLHMSPKQVGRNSGGERRLMLTGMVERTINVLKNKYQGNPEELKDLVSECSLSEEETNDLIRYSKEYSFGFNTASESEIRKCERIKEKEKDLYVKCDAIRDHKDSPRYNCALTLGRLYLSDIAMRAYSELSGKEREPKGETFIEKVLKSVTDQDIKNVSKTNDLFLRFVNQYEIYQSIFLGK